MLGVFFHIKALQAPVLPKYYQTCPNFPYIARKAPNQSMTSNEKCSALFCKIKAYTAIL